MPEILHKVPAEYSDEARNARRSGIVVLAVTVDATGKVTNAQVIESLGMGLDEKAIEAVKTWSFRPGYQGGRPVSVTLKVEVDFQVQ
jgi:periplasmic protein TonB